MKKRSIISLLPSCTEIVCALDCTDRLVGRSHECDFPPEIRRLPACSSAKLNIHASSAEIDREVKSLLQRALSIYEIDTEKLKQLRPDIILTQSQCEVCAVSESDLEKAISDTLDFHPKILSLSPKKMADLWGDIQKVAEALDVQDRGRKLVQELKTRVVDIIEKTCVLSDRPNVACIEWIEPLMAAGNWVPELVEFAAGRCIFGEAGKHSPWMKWEDLVRRDPAFIIVMPCGFDIPRTRKEMEVLTRNPEWRKLRAVQKENVFLTDGNQYFNRPGPRLVDSLEILAEIIQPKLFRFGHEKDGWQRL